MVRFLDPEIVEMVDRSYIKNYKKPVEAVLDQANVDFELKFKLILKFITYLSGRSVMIGGAGL